MMASKFRIGQVAGALSSGLGIFAEKKYKEEQEALERQWKMTLQNIADARAQARNDQEFQRQLALNAQRNAMGVQDREDTQRFQSQQQTERIAADDKRFDKMSKREEQKEHERLAADRLEMYWKRRSEIDEKYTDMLANPMVQMNSEEQERIRLQKDNELDRLAGSFAQSMILRAQQYPDARAYSEYRVNGRDEVASIVSSLGASSAGADKVADRFMKWASMPGGADTAGAGGGRKWSRDGKVDATGETMESLRNDTGGYNRPAAGPAARRVEPEPVTPLPSETTSAATGEPEPLYPGVPSTPPDSEPWAGTRRFGREFGRRVEQIPQGGQQPLFNRYGPNQ